MCGVQRIFGGHKIQFQRGRLEFLLPTSWERGLLTFHSGAVVILKNSHHLLRWHLPPLNLYPLVLNVISSERENDSRSFVTWQHGSMVTAPHVTVESFPSHLQSTPSPNFLSWSWNYRASSSTTMLILFSPQGTKSGINTYRKILSQSELFSKGTLVNLKYYCLYVNHT